MTDTTDPVAALVRGLLRDEDDDRLLDVATGDGHVDLADPDAAVRILCLLHSVVSRSGATPFPDVSADCFCGEGPYSAGDSLKYWRNEGHSLTFIVQATLAALTNRETT